MHIFTKTEQYLCRDSQLIEGFQAAPSPMLPLDISGPDLFLFLHTDKDLSSAALYSFLFFLVNLTFQYQGLIVFLGKPESSSPTFDNQGNDQLWGDC